MATRPLARCTVFTVALVLGALISSPAVRADPTVPSLEIESGLCVVLDLPRGAQAEDVVGLTKGNEVLVYFQSADAKDVAAVRRAADTAGLLGSRITAAVGDLRSIPLADNLADAVLAHAARPQALSEKELLRVLHPGASAVLRGRTIVKPPRAGTDSWSHPYHRPDNNPQSTDQLARAPYRTQFLGAPLFSPMPEVTVAAGGRLFKACGHIAHKANQDIWLNTLLCINGYNGAILWKRPLHKGFMIHRNTLIATPDALLLADDVSCKRIDARSGKVLGEIVVPEGLSDGPVWKWMGLENGVLYALVGARELRVPTQQSQTPGIGHWPWGMWPGHDYADPRTNFGFGRTLIALRPESGKVIWSHREKEYIDSRGVCLKGGKLYYYSPEKFLACLETAGGNELWKTSDPELLAAIGPNEKAQHYVTGFSTTTYIKCNDKYIFFAGPQRKRLVVARAADGKLLWKNDHGNVQLVLRDDGFYAAGPRDTGAKLDYATGKVLARLPRRRACTRATGAVDCIFYRTPGGTVRIDAATDAAQHIAPMRPPCQDGVIISDGLLYWGPWMCGCQLSLYGNICLAPAGAAAANVPGGSPQLERGAGDTTSVRDFPVAAGDWPCYRRSNQRRAETDVKLPAKVRLAWTFTPAAPRLPTAPVAAGGLVFTGDRAGAVRALDGAGKVRWTAWTGGPVYYPPAVAGGRVAAGSADGKVHVFEAATGRLLWRYRLAPRQRRIPVYGSLISTWPVAGGVVVKDGVVYAAAGITHYDGTYVAALDLATGKVLWRNDTSGSLAKTVDCGISLQGPVYLRGGELCFAGGGAYQTARYDLQTGKCLNPPRGDVNSSFQTAFYAYYPDYAQYLSLHVALPGGRTLRYDASYDGSRHSSLALLAPPGAGTRPTPRQTDRRQRDRARPPQRKAIWEVPGRRYNSLVVAPGAVLAAGRTGLRGRTEAFLAAVRLRDGAEAWRVRLPAAAVKGGTAVDSRGRILVCLEDGRVLCFEAAAGGGR